MDLPLEAEEGFRELLGCAGVELAWEAVTFQALVRRAEPKEHPLRVTPGDDGAVTVSALASGFSDGLPPVGAFFTGAGASYRVTARRNMPGNAVVAFECEVQPL